MSAKNFVSYGDAETVLTGFANAIKSKANISDLGTAAAKNSTNAVTSGSTDLIESGAVKDAIDAAVSSAYHHAGTKTVAQLTHDLLVAANEGNVYNITDSGTTTSDFVEGIGKTINAGDNVGICKVGNDYMFDLLSGFVDTSNFVQKSQTAGLLENDGTVNTTIENTVAGHTTAIDEINSNLSSYEVQNNTNLDVPNRKNVLPLTIDKIKAANTSGTWDGNSYTKNGVTYTVHTDSSGKVTDITANGEANSNSDFYLYSAMDSFLSECEGMILNGVTGGSASTYGIGLYGQGIKVTTGDVTIDAVMATAPAVYIRVNDGNTVNNVVFTPMIRPATITDPTFAPYIPSVESRIKAVESELDDVNTIQVPPNASNKITLVRGGYVKLGRMVLVNVIVTATDDISSPNTAILWGFPSAGTINQPLIIIEDGENTIKDTATTRMYENTLYCGFALENGKTYVISGIYNAIT